VMADKDRAVPEDEVGVHNGPRHEMAVVAGVDAAVKTVRRGRARGERGSAECSDGRQRNEGLADHEISPSLFRMRRARRLRTSSQRACSRCALNAA
jgi:hypothetical protein